MANISEILKSAREKSNLSIDDLSEQTKVRPNIIRAIEDHDFSNFQSVYLKAFIRNIAKELQIDDDPDYIAAFEEFTTELKQAKNNPSKDATNIGDLKEYTSPIQAKKTEKIFRSSPILNTNFLIYSGIVLFLIVIIIITFFPLRKTTNSENSNTNSSNNNNSTLEIKDKNDNPIMSLFTGSDSLHLKANVTDSVWMNISIDSLPKSKSILLPNKEYEWSAKNSFIITHGNAGNIKFFLNGKELEPFAKPGYIANNVRITREGIFLSPSAPDSIKKARAKRKIENSAPPLRSIEPTEIEEIRPKLK
ncbi:MAG: helix-turn-helix domain-containing protein [Chloroherpetonaceae bacterium]